MIPVSIPASEELDQHHDGERAYVLYYPQIITQQDFMKHQHRDQIQEQD